MGGAGRSPWFEAWCPTGGELDRLVVRDRVEVGAALDLAHLDALLEETCHHRPVLRQGRRVRQAALRRLVHLRRHVAERGRDLNIAWSATAARSPCPNAASVLYRTWAAASFWPR